MSELLTKGRMLRLLAADERLRGLTLFNLNYRIRRMGIQPAAVAGNIPVYTAEQFLLIQQTLLDVAARRQKKQAGCPA